jgi:ABC-2 type transport system permease protein
VFAKKLEAYRRFLVAAFAANLQSAMEYRVNFLIQVFGMMLNNAAFAVFWKVLIDRTGGIGGYGFVDVMALWALVSTAFGFAHIFFGNIRNLGAIIQKGELDVYLLQPKDPWLNVLVSRTSISAWGDMLYGYVVLAFLPAASAPGFLLFTLLAVIGALILASTFAAAESLAFFLGDSSALSQALTEFMLSFSLYPETIFDREARWIFYSIVPSGFVAFLPLAAWKALDWGMVPLLALAALLYALASRALFKAGLKRYESGNQMGARL